MTTISVPINQADAEQGLTTLTPKPAIPTNRAESTSKETNVSTEAASTNLKSEPALGRAVTQALRNVGAATPKQLGRLTGISELIIRSVLEALTFVQTVDFDRQTGEYSASAGPLRDYALLPAG